MPPKTIEQVYQESLVRARSSQPTFVHNGKLYKWKGCVTNFVIGELKCRCFPYFSLTIFDTSFVIPCIVLNPVKNINKLLKLCDHTILLNEPEFVVEIYATNSNEYCLVHILINAEKLHIIEKNIKLFTRSLKRPKNDALVPSNEDVLDQWFQKFVPLKISSAILTFKSEIFCFVLILIINSEQLDSEEYVENSELVWLILKNEQVIWKDFLLPNRIYTIYNSPDLPHDYFRRFGSLISVINKNLDQTFHQMIHHKDLIKTNAAIFLPKNSKIYSSLQSTLKISCSEKWFSISDAKLQSLKFASIYGIIKDIKYFQSWKSGSCLWCNSDNNIFEATFKDPYSLQNETIDNDFDLEWNCTVSDVDENVEDDKICFPEASFFIPEGEKINGFGIKGGKLTIQITLKKRDSNYVVYVFLKRWQQEQYPVGLIEGVTVCLTDLNIKRSNKWKNIYFVGTPLTRVFHLNTTECDSDPWRKFGFPSIKVKKQEVWGILDLDLLTKVSISAKCKLCNQAFLQFCCSNIMCPNNRKQMCPDYAVIATARLFVRGFVGCEASSLFLKNENVQKYLGIPGRIWLKLCQLSANSELLYIHQREELLDQYENDVISAFFRAYCKFYRPKIRFHVLCRSFKDDENRYFCIELKEITEQRLMATRGMIDKAVMDQETY